MAEAEAQAVAPQRRASWGSKDRPAIATSTKPHVNGDVDESVWLRGLAGLYSAGSSTLMVAKIEDRAGVCCMALMLGPGRPTSAPQTARNGCWESSNSGTLWIIQVWWMKLKSGLPWRANQSSSMIRERFFFI